MSPEHGRLAAGPLPSVRRGAFAGLRPVLSGHVLKDWLGHLRLPVACPGLDGDPEPPFVCAHSPPPCLPVGDRAAYCKAANKRVMDVINSARTRQQMLHAQTFHGDSLWTQEDAAASGDRRPALDTWIYPLIQMKPFAIQIDELVTETLLTEAERGARVYLTTGYFNLTQAYMDLVLGTRAEYQILLASPEVNGFFGAKGVAGAIPAAYVHIERQFYSEVRSLGQQERVQLQEYWRRGWTFHAKGMWPPARARLRTGQDSAPRPAGARPRAGAHLLAPCPLPICRCGCVPVVAGLCFLVMQVRSLSCPQMADLGSRG